MSSYEAIANPLPRRRIARYAESSSSSRNRQAAGRGESPLCNARAAPRCNTRRAVNVWRDSSSRSVRALFPFHEVAHLHDALLDLDERAVAAVAREPNGAANGRGGESALRPEAALCLAPELADRLRRRCSGGSKMPATLTESVPTNTSVPRAARLRTKLSTAPPPGPPPLPMACHPPPSRYATSSAAAMWSRFEKPPPAYSTPRLSAASAYTAPLKSPSVSTVDRAAPVFRSHASR